MVWVEQGYEGGSEANWDNTNRQSGRATGSGEHHLGLKSGHLVAFGRAEWEQVEG